MNLKNYKLNNQYDLSLFGSQHIYSIYVDSKNLKIKIIKTKEDGFSKKTKEMSIQQIVQLQADFKNDINNPTKQIAHISFNYSKLLENIIADYNSIKQVFDNYHSLNDSLENLLESKKTKPNKI